MFGNVFDCVGYLKAGCNRICVITEFGIDKRVNGGMCIFGNDFWYEAEV